MSQPSNLSSLYAELNRFGQNGEYDRALKVVNKILQEVPDDDKAYHCKIICLIHLSEFESAYQLVEKSPLTLDLQFEKAYCLYRLNKIQQAWSILEHSQTNDKLKELSAQVLYRLERYDECYETYKHLIKNSEDEYEEERETNLAAVIGGLCAEKGKPLKNMPQLQEHTFELCYNGACILLAQNQYAAAIKKLQLAEELCKKTLEEDDVPEEEIEAELGVIRTQMGYALHMQGKVDQALKLYNQVLKQRPTDIALAAVASNNVVTINKDQNVFDSKKKIKTATSEGLEFKLNSNQCQTIAINHCLLLLHTNQIEQCRRQLQLFQKKFNDKSVDAILIQVALLCREKQVTKAVSLLKEFAAANPDQSLTISFTLVQLLLTQGHVSQACDVLRSLSDISYKPGVVSALVTLYLNLEEKESAIDVFEQACEWYRKNKPQSHEITSLVQEYAEFLLKSGQAEKGAKLLEEMRKSDPHNSKILAQLISAYSQFDPVKAKEVSRELPSLDMSETIDVDNLEMTSWTMGAKYVKKTGKNEPSPTPKTNVNEEVVKKKKKKKKGKLPKSYDPNIDPDPERWLPKRERTAFKRRKDRRTGAGVGKGTQGAIAGAEMEVTKPAVTTRAPTATSVSTNVPASPNPHGPRQQRPQAVQKKKKKKGRW